jgi:beta-1,4-N-acetylglucosaminyltransferase
VTFVTVGNATDGFRRLLDTVETLAGAGLLPMPVVIQSGNNAGFTSRLGLVRPFLSMEDFEDYVRRARLVIAHAGAGTVLHALAAGKLPVVMPRRACRRPPGRAR